MLCLCGSLKLESFSLFRQKHFFLFFLSLSHSLPFSPSLSSAQRLCNHVWFYSYAAFQWHKNPTFKSHHNIFKEVDQVKLKARKWQKLSQHSLSIQYDYYMIRLVGSRHVSLKISAIHRKKEMERKENFLTAHCAVDRKIWFVFRINFSLPVVRFFLNNIKIMFLWYWNLIIWFASSHCFPALLESFFGGRLAASDRAREINFYFQGF